MTKIFHFFAKNHIFALLFTFMLLLMGGKTMNTINKDVFPKVDFGELFIFTQYPSGSPEDVELNVTNKIEDAIDDISGIDEYTSVSLEGASRISVRLDQDHGDLEQVKQNIRDAVNRISDFPSEVKELPKVINIDSSIFPFIEVGLASDLPYEELRKKADQFERELSGLSGIAKIDMFGFRDREVKIELNPDRLNYFQMPIPTVLGVLRERNIRKSVGTLKHFSEEKNILTASDLKTVPDIENVIVRSTFEGNLVRIKDVASVYYGFEDRLERVRMNGKNAVLFLVFKSEQGDLLELTKRLKAFVEEKRKTIDGASIYLSRDVSKYLENRYNVVKNNGLIGLLFLLTVLTLFLNSRVALWVGLSIPVILSGTVWLLQFFIPHLDIVTMAAFIIVMGIIVDDSIIVSENILRRRELGDTPLDAAVNGLKEVFGPVLTTILTTFMAFSPMFFMPGIIGKFIVVIPLVVSLALFVSLFEVVIALPAHMVPAVRTIKPKQDVTSWFDSIRSFFDKSMFVVLRFRYVVVIAYILFFFAAIAYVAKTKNFELFPSEMAEYVYVEVECPLGSSIEATSEKAREVEAVILSLPESELDGVSTKVGTAGMNDQQVRESVRHAQLSIYLTSFTKRERMAQSIVDELRAKTDNIEGATIRYNIDGGGPPVGSAVEIRVSHFDDAVRLDVTNRIKSFLEKVTGVFDVRSNDMLGKDQLELVIKEERISRLGLTVSDITKTVETAFKGRIATSARIEGEDVDFRVIFPESSRYDMEMLKSLPVSNKAGRLIRLDELVSLKEMPGVPDYYHFEGERTTTITSNLDKKQNNSFKVYQELNKLIQEASWLNGARVEFGGESEETTKSFQDLFKTFLLALLGIYFLLILLFNSLIQPLMVVLCVPFGLIGVIFAFAIHQKALSFFSMLGSIGLAGVLVNDALVLVYRINTLKKLKKDEPILNLVVQGTSERLRPIILTSLTTIAGVLPLAYGIGGSDPFIAPMGLALGYGLFFSTPLILAFIPSLYLIKEDIRSFFRAKFLN